MSIIKKIICLFALPVFDRKYFPYVNGYYILRGIIGKLLLNNVDTPWPSHPNCKIQNPENIEFDPSSIRVFQQSGCFYQAVGKIRIGKGCYIAQNVGIITTNHDVKDLDGVTAPEDVIIGDHCWIGMNAMILPGVTLGDHTVVGAGSIVTKSFPGNCVIVGNPAKVIK
jgi:acetyltransferase-like isoleucine patch superfamily enzyme